MERFKRLTIQDDRIFMGELWIASINHETKEVRPTHGYFKKHPHGYRSEQYAKHIGYTFNNN
jgi:hypothetical protein